MQLTKHSVGLRGVSILLLAVVIAASAALAIFNAQIAGYNDRTQLMNRAVTIADVLDTSPISKLTGTNADLTNAEYKNLKTRLTQLKQANGDVRALYIAGQHRDGQLFFYVDSETPGTSDYSPPGDPYNEASPAFKAMFVNGTPLVEGPLQDHFGTWVSGLAPIIDQQTGKVAAVIGLDIDATQYNADMWLAAAIPLAVGVIFVIVILIYEWIRRRDQQVIRMRSELVSIATHELRSPITGIRWATESLLKSTANTPNAATTKAIYDSIIHLQAGIEDILQLTRLTSQKSQKLNLAPCNIVALIKEVNDTQALAAQQKQVQLIMDDSWPATLTITCDADKIKRALHNLVSNAIKYTRTGTPVTWHYQSSAKEHIFSITDQGIGIPKAEQNRVFAGFYRASNAKATGVEGTGLGLFLTRTIIAQHKGKLSFTSDEGKGTTFTFTLPNKKEHQ